MELLDRGLLAAAMTNLSSFGNGSGSSVSGEAQFQLDDVDSFFSMSDYFLADNLPRTPSQPEIAYSYEQHMFPDPAVLGNNIREALPPLPRMEEGSRIAFRIQTDDENLNDGFKWRKYGKKTVKNSPNPRNYYRCSTDGCSVKKRVERDSEDPRYVITTYEGIHNHSTPGAVYYAMQDRLSGRFLLSGSQLNGTGCITMASTSSSLT